MDDVVFPDASRAPTCLPVKKAVRHAEGLGEGDPPTSSSRSSSEPASTAPARNRVDPSATSWPRPGGATSMGNRGRLHDGAGTRDVRRHHVGRAWITCLLDVPRPPRAAVGPEPLHAALLPRRGGRARGRAPSVRRVPSRRLQPASATSSRRATARATCRRPGSTGCSTTSAGTRGGAPAGCTRTPGVTCPTAPTCCWVSGPAVVTGGGLLPWLPDNTYAATLRRGPRAGIATVITPPSSVEALRAGFEVRVGRRPGGPQASPSSSSEKA